VTLSASPGVPRERSRIGPAVGAGGRCIGLDQTPEIFEKSPSWPRRVTFRVTLALHHSVLRKGPDAGRPACDSTLTDRASRREQRKGDTDGEPDHDHL